MVIYRDDLTNLEAKRGSLAALIGNFTGIGVFGSLTLPTYKIEVTIKDDRGQEMVNWVPIQVAVKAGPRVGSNYRISGPWMRHRFFVASSPDNTGLLCVSKNKTALSSLVTTVPEDRFQNPPPEISPDGGIPPAPLLNFGTFISPGPGGSGGENDGHGNGDDGPGAPPAPAPFGPPSPLTGPPARFGPFEPGPGPTGFGPGPVNFASGPVGPRPSDSGRDCLRRGPTLSPIGSPQMGPLPGLAGDNGREEPLRIGVETPVLEPPLGYGPYDESVSESTDTPIVVVPRRLQHISALVDPLKALSPVQGLLLPQPGGGQFFPPRPLPVVPSQRMEIYEARPSSNGSPVFHSHPLPERAEKTSAVGSLEREEPILADLQEMPSGCLVEEELAKEAQEEAQVDTEASTNIEESSSEEEEGEGDSLGDSRTGNFSSKEPLEGANQEPLSDTEMEM